MSNPVISEEDQARSRKAADSARWSALMAGFGVPEPDCVALDELWITGQITKEERRDRIHDMLRQRPIKPGHTPRDDGRETP
jgi:hypothetical protein